MAWTNLAAAFSYGAVLTSTQMQQLRDNIAAAFAKASGAPTLASGYVVNAMMASAAIKQANLSTSTATASHSGTPAAAYTVASGSYGMYPQLKISSGFGGTTGHAATMNDSTTSGLSTSYQTLISLLAQAGATITAQFRYVLSSPPFDLGDGDIPLFVFALVDNGSGKVVGVTTAEVPPWAYNGPTDIAATRYSGDGRAFKRVWVPDDAVDEVDIIQTSALPLAVRLKRAGEWGEVEVGQALKNADMGLIPHPFHGDLSGKTVVLLDPMSRELSRLAESVRAGQIIDDMLFDGDIRIDNTPLARRTPAGVQACGFRMR